jgi:hypothetical protein
MESIIAVCSSIDSGGACDGTISYVTAYLLPVDSAPMLELLLAGGFDEEIAMLGFFGVISLFVAGFSVGIIANIIRKLRSV